VSRQASSDQDGYLSSLANGGFASELATWRLAVAERDRWCVKRQRQPFPTERRQRAAAGGLCPRPAARTTVIGAIVHTRHPAARAHDGPCDHRRRPTKSKVSSVCRRSRARREASEGRRLRSAIHVTDQGVPGSVLPASILIGLSGKGSPDSFPGGQGRNSVRSSSMRAASPGSVVLMPHKPVDGVSSS